MRVALVRILLRANEGPRQRNDGVRACLHSTPTPFLFLHARQEPLMSQEKAKSTPPRARRSFLRKAGAVTSYAALMAMVPPGVRHAAWVAGSDAPEKKEVKVGFIPLTDCASVVMASVLEFDKKYGIKITPTKEASWASVRDKLVNGDIDASHVLYGLIYGLHLGVSGPKKDMAMLMGLNQNGQAITLSKKLADAGVR